ncbi:hypothetical protein DFH07DRAFT_776367 [Mycena maculata]|uniref:Cytochrome P450 n=1 Tax=Mycena maculata TaxID=230809 RepID=A0AAD7N6I4_9AGAR|nr:hypothetical protein DFH07DRAFT_776367 [Mycena maculata]
MTIILLSALFNSGPSTLKILSYKNKIGEVKAVNSILGFDSRGIRIATSTILMQFLWILRRRNSDSDRFSRIIDSGRFSMLESVVESTTESAVNRCPLTALTPPNEASVVDNSGGKNIFEDMRTRVVGPEISEISTLLVNEAGFNFGRPVKTRYILGQLVGPGILVVEGDVHKEQNLAFGPQQIRELTGLCGEISKASRHMSGFARVDIIPWLTKVNLDIIGLAGFNYDFNSLASFKPAFCIIADTVIQSSQAAMIRIGQKLLRESREEISYPRSWLPAMKPAGIQLFIERSHIHFIFVNSTAATWALFALSENVEIQSRLRKELPTLDITLPPYMSSMPFSISTVLSERLCAYMQLLSSFIFGGPPGEMGARPPISTSIPGIWGQMLTFYGGPCACIGFHFLLVELKALLFTLIQGLEFKLVVPTADMGRREITVAQQPVLRSNDAAGSQTTLLIKPFNRSFAI